MMEYEHFKENIAEKIRMLTAGEKEECRIEVETRYKVNERLDALTLVPVKKSGKLRAYPVFYLQELYDLYLAGNSLERIGRYVVSMMNEVPSVEIIEKGTFSPENMREEVILQLINYERNLQMLEGIPHRRFLDLAVIYRAVIQYGEGQWSGMIVTNEIMDEWNMTEEDLYRMAWERTPERYSFVLKDTGRMFSGGIVVESGQGRMHFLTTEFCRFGAAAMLYPDILKMAADIYGSGFTILPGSIHELYLMKETEEEAVAWKEAVECANAELVRPSEYLSDSIYYYNRESETITILL